MRQTNTIGLLALAGLTTALTGCGNNGSGKPLPGGTSTATATSSTPTTKKKSPSPTPSPKATPTPKPTPSPSPSPSPTGSGTWLFVAENNLDRVTAFAVDATSGALIASSVTTQLASGARPQMLAVDPTNAVLVASLNGAGSAQSFLINKTTGALAAKTTFATAPGPVGVAIDPSSKLVLTGNQNGSGSESLSIMSLDATTGALAAGVPASATGAGTETWGVAVDGQGSFVYACDYGSSDLSVFALTNGVLAPIGSNVTTDSNPHMVAVTPNGKFVYTANLGATNGSISIFTSNNGTLTPGTPSNVPVTSGSSFASCREIAIDPSGKFLFSANGSLGDVCAFKIDQTTGALTQVGSNASLNHGTSSYAEGIVVHPTLSRIYVADNQADKVTAFSFDATTGALVTPGEDTALPAGGGAFGLAISR